MLYSLKGMLLRGDNLPCNEVNKDYLLKITPLLKLSDGNSTSCKVLDYVLKDCELTLFLPFQEEIASYYGLPLSEIFLIGETYEITIGDGRVVNFELKALLTP